MTDVPLGLDLGSAVFLGVLAVALCMLVLRRPVVAVIAMLLALLFRSALAPYFPKPPFWLALVLLLGSAFLWWLDNRHRSRAGVGPIEAAMTLYLSWIAYSMVQAHEFPATVGNPTITKLSVASFVICSALIPFVLFMFGRFVLNRPSAVRALLWAVLLLAGYSAAQAVLQFHGKQQWMWPRLGTDPTTTWVGRAAGVTGQPVENGIVLGIGIAIAIQVISHHRTPLWQRTSAAVIALGCGYGIYLTYTRAAWLSGAIVLVIGAVLGRGHRRWFLAALGAVAAVILTHWSTFSSADRTAGGVGSVGEVEDRLNMIKTALWAAGQRPLTGWGIGRFQAVNTYHHQQWSPEVPWVRGYSIVSHQNELGILAELGFIGLGLWVLTVGLIVYRLWAAYRRLPDSGLTGRPLAVTALMAIAVFVNSGFTVDLRFLVFGTCVVFLLAGMAVGWCDRHERAVERFEPRTPTVEQQALVTNG